MNSQNLSDYDISLRGQLSVNLPVTVIIVFTAFGLSMFLDVNFKIALFIGMVLGWSYWSFSVKKWICLSVRMKKKMFLRKNITFHENVGFFNCLGHFL